MSTIDVGELLYEFHGKFTGVTEFGVSMEALTSGQTAPPPQGARIDVSFEGQSVAGKLQGGCSGVDHLHIRGDGQFGLHIHATLTGPDGNIALFADGVATPREGSTIVDLRENATLSTAVPAYTWVNGLQVWAVGTVDLATQEIVVKGYSA